MTGPQPKAGNFPDPNAGRGGGFQMGSRFANRGGQQAKPLVQPGGPQPAQQQMGTHQNWGQKLQAHRIAHNEAVTQHRAQMAAQKQAGQANYQQAQQAQKQAGQANQQQAQQAQTQQQLPPAPQMPNQQLAQANQAAQAQQQQALAAQQAQMQQALAAQQQQMPPAPQMPNQQLAQANYQQQLAAQQAQQQAMAQAQQAQFQMPNLQGVA